MDSLFDIVEKKDNEQLLLDIFQAYYDARRNKRNKKASLKFELDFETKLIKLHKDIIDKNYEPLPSIAFINTKPVIREVFAADFRDRVVHHLIYNHISPIFEKEFITDSYSCRKNKNDLQVDLETIDYLIHKTIFSDPTKNVKKYRDENWKILPKNKSLFYAKKGKNARNLNFNSDNAYDSWGNRANGFSVRCTKD
jgi:retron-type reverse transcriptase